MAECAFEGAFSENSWICQNCSASNKAETYRCSTCAGIKPYFSSSQPSLKSDQPPSPISAPSIILKDQEMAWSSYQAGGAECGGARPKSFRHKADAGLDTERGSGRPSDESDESLLEFPDGICRLVLLGKTGHGKSSTGNTLLGRSVFKVGKTFRSTTAWCQWRETERFGLKLEIVDTPGFFDTNVDEVEVTKEIIKCVGMVAPGPHALLIVLRADVRFTLEEARTVNHIRSTFGDDIMRHVIVVFTRGDCLEDEGIEEMLVDCPPELSALLEETDRRFVVFNNKEVVQEKNSQQVKRLLQTVRGKLATTDNKHFTNPFLLRCEQHVLRHAAQLTDMLEGTQASETAKQLIRAGLEAKDKAEELLQLVLDTHASEMEALQRTARETLALENEILRRQMEEKQVSETEALRKKMAETLALEKEALRRQMEEKHALETEALRKEVKKILQDKNTLQVILTQTKKVKGDIEKELKQEKSKWMKCVVL